MNEPNTRGEVTINLDATYVMRPSYEAIEAIETATGRGVVALLMSSGQGDLSLRETSIIVCEFIKAWGKECIATGDNSPEARSASGSNVRKVGELVYKAGLVKVVPRVQFVLGAAVTGGAIATGETEATTGTETPAVA